LTVLGSEGGGKMAGIVIKNGFVFDPLNGIAGEQMDIYVDGGKIVEEVKERKAKVINASGMTVMPGGVDIHSHIAGSKVNTGRSLRPEDHRKDAVPKTKYTRSGVGYSVPTTYVTGYRYAKMGYTTVIEPAVPPLKARHTHEELNDTPIVDSGFLTLMDNNYLVMKYVRDDEFEKLKAFVAWLLRATRGYTIKIVNPGGVENWKWGGNVDSIDDEVKNFNITPREIIRGLVRAREELGLPHVVQLHASRLGVPGNYETTLKTMQCCEDIKASDDREGVMHVVHVQFNSFAGESFADFRSGASEVAEYVNKHKHVALDLGQVIFTDTTTMTGDGPWQYRLHKLTGNKWVNGDVELEAGSGVVPYTFKSSSPVNAVQWAIGLEVALLVEDPWRVYLTTDHPNGGPFIYYPKVMAWLMSEKARSDMLEEAHKFGSSRTALPSIDREYDFNEIAIVTRAGTAKALGLKNKGRLGVGADADVAIYDIDPKKFEPSNYEEVEKAFSAARYTIKDGEIVVKEGEVVASPIGRRFWVNVKVPDDIEKAVLGDLREVFEKYYTVSLENYPVQDEYLPKPEEIRIDATEKW